MKKTIVMLAMLSILTASAVSCSSDISVEAVPQTNASAAVTTVAGETTAANTTAAQAGAAVDAAQNAAPVQAAPAGNTANNTPAQQSGNTAAVKDEGQTSPCINPEFHLFGGYVATQKDDLNLRKEPNTSSEVLAKIPNGTQIDVYSSDVSGWYQTIFDNKKGYVSAEFVKEIESYDGGAAPAPQANDYGFYSVIAPPASSISVASLTGTWKAADDIPETLVITGGADIYNGYFTWTGSDGYTINGYICLEYLVDHDVQNYYYTFYQNDGTLWEAFSATGEIPLNDLYAGQSGAPHFVRS